VGEVVGGVQAVEVSSVVRVVLANVPAVGPVAYLASRISVRVTDSPHAFT
jgi:hypothetical protein